MVRGRVVFVEGGDSWFSYVSACLVAMLTVLATFEAELITKRFHPFHASLV